MRRIIILLCLIVGLFNGSHLKAQQLDIPSPPQHWVTDVPNILTKATRDGLNKCLKDYQTATGHQVLVWIGTSTGELPLENWTTRAFESWKIGRAGIDDGIILFVFNDDKKLRIEVGYGLEGKVPDIIASRIIKDVIVPNLQRGDADTAIVNGVSHILKAIEGDGYTVSNNMVDKKVMGKGAWVIILILGLAMLILVIINPNLAIWIILNILYSGRGGGDHDSRGGGGRSGGGGASGSW